MEPTDNPLEELQQYFLSSPRDWSSDERDAWAYGIVCGWDSRMLKYLAQRHGWSNSDVEKLRSLRCKFFTLKNRGNRRSEDTLESLVELLQLAESHRELTHLTFILAAGNRFSKPDIKTAQLRVEKLKGWTSGLL